jgi:hypothetical protein
MFRKKLWVAAVAAVGLGSIPAMAAVEYSVIELDAAPPPARVEVAPPLREGSTWIPGYWDYSAGNYSWVPGHFEANRAGYVYMAPRYEQADGRWRMYAGGWGRRGEEEHGGVRNRIADKIRGKDDD